MDFSNNSEWDINAWITQTLAQNNKTDQTTSLVKSPSLSGSDPDTSVVGRRKGVANPKISKRRSRSSKKNMTTVIHTDPENFKQMVHQATGLAVDNGQVAVAPVLKPEPQRLVPSADQGSWPTFDSSAFINGQPQQQFDVGVGPTYTVPLGGYAPVTEVGGGGGFSFEPDSSFPALEE